MGHSVSSCLTSLITSSLAPDAAASGDDKWAAVEAAGGSVAVGSCCEEASTTAELTKLPPSVSLHDDTLVLMSSLSTSTMSVCAAWLQTRDAREWRPAVSSSRSVAFSNRSRATCSVTSVGWQSAVTADHITSAIFCIHWIFSCACRQHGARRDKNCNANTRARACNGPLSRTNRFYLSKRRRVAVDSAGRMQVCTSLHAITPPLSFYRPDALPAAQPTASK